MAKTQANRHEFNGTVIPAGWSEFLAGSATITYSSTGAKVVLPASTTAATDGDITSTASFSLIDSYAMMEVNEVPVAGAVSTDCNMTLQITGANLVQWQYEGGSLYAIQVVASAQTNHFSVTFDPVLHRWWKIKEVNGQTLWQTSPDGMSWTTHHTQANPITMTALFFNIAAICFGVDSNPGNFEFRNLNCPPAEKILNNSGIRPYPFAPGLAR